MATITAMPTPSPAQPPHRTPLWLATRRHAAWGLLLWLAVTVLPLLFARDLDRWWGAQVAAYLWASQGAVLAYVLLTFWTCDRMDRLEAADRPHDGE